ncbi:MAG: polysaccharide pyruvyl transferase family protein, partial [bacterium]|nr:polysaccharide pyruvyl transferase family protein [bacterium]
LLTQYLPEAKIILWSSALDRGVREMLERNFPKLEIVGGSPEEAAVSQAFDEADFLLHGSGPSVVARDHLAAWRKRTGKPYGIFGVTITLRDEAASAALDSELRDLLEGATFVYTRETRSLENLKKAGIQGPEIGFAPDGAFSLKLLDEDRARAFLNENGLATKKFIAVVPRLRYTPYHKMRKVDWPEERIRRRTAVNEKHAEADHAKLREVKTLVDQETERLEEKKQAARAIDAERAELSERLTEAKESRSDLRGRSQVLRDLQKR